MNFFECQYLSFLKIKKTNHGPYCKKVLFFSIQNFAMDCIVPNCGTRRTETLHVFPKSEILGQEWLRAVQAPKLAELSYEAIRKKQYRVCFRHFEKCCYIATFQKPRLKDNAIPSINLPARPIENLNESNEDVPMRTLNSIPNPATNLTDKLIDYFDEIEEKVSVDTLSIISVPNKLVLLDRGSSVQQPVSSDAKEEVTLRTAVTKNIDASVNAASSEEIENRVVESKNIVKVHSAVAKDINKTNVSNKSTNGLFGVRKRIQRRLVSTKSETRDYTPRAKKFLLEVNRLRKNLYKTNGRLKRYIKEATVLRNELINLKNNMHFECKKCNT